MDKVKYGYTNKKENSQLFEKDGDVYTKQDIESIVRGFMENECYVLEDYSVRPCENTMMGFLCEYQKMRATITCNGNNIRELHFFIKSVPRNNKAKADTLTDYQVWEKEIIVYTKILHKFTGDKGPERWRAKCVKAFEKDIIFEDLTFLGFKMRNKLLHFDLIHLKTALNSLAELHSQSIIHEEVMSKKLGKVYSFGDYYDEYFSRSGYTMDNKWFLLCIDAGLEAIQEFSNYGKDSQLFEVIKRNWKDVFSSGLESAKRSNIYRNAICHRDLWANNIMFRYELSAPVECAFVDFQATDYQPPACDVTSLIYLNTDLPFRDVYYNELIDYYFIQLNDKLERNGVHNVISLDEFKTSCEVQRKWALILCAALLPQIWMDTEKMQQEFEDPNQFDIKICKYKCEFVKRMMLDDKRYRLKILEVMEEIVDRFILKTK